MAGAHEREADGIARPVAARPPATLLRGPPPVDYSDMPAFLQRPAPEGALVQCHIARSKGGFMSSYPRYVMMLKQPGQSDVTLLAARKRGQSK
jgi:hypothetical protein